MKTPNHLAGGLVITGFCTALCGLNIFSSPASIAVMAIASLLPDIDHPKSIIGRSLKPISLAINRRLARDVSAPSRLSEPSSRSMCSS